MNVQIRTLNYCPPHYYPTNHIHASLTAAGPACISPMPVVITVALYCFEIVKCESSNFVLFQDYFGCSGFLAILSEFQNQLINFYNEVSWDYDRDCTESVDHIGAHFHLSRIAFQCMNMRCFSIYLNL